jgi:hypothetical protein
VEGKNLPLDTIIEVACGLYPRGSDGGEPLMTLNVIQSGGFLGSIRRHLFGYWLAPELKAQVFETIEEFVRKNQIPLKMIRYGPLFGKAGPEPKIGVPSKPVSIDKDSPIEVTENEEKLRLQWSTRSVCTEKVTFYILLIFLIGWTFFTIVLTYEILKPNVKISSRIFGAFWLVFGYGGICILGYVLAQRFWIEWIEVSREYVSQGRRGLFAGKPKAFPLDSIYELGLSPKDPTVSMTISYGRPDRRKRRTFGYWVNPEFKEKIFGSIEDFVARKQIPLRMARYGP